MNDDIRFPHPSKPGVLVSRQRLWQLRAKREGLCQVCARPSGSASNCELCRAKSKARYQARVRQSAIRNPKWKEVA